MYYAEFCTPGFIQNYTTKLLQEVDETWWTYKLSCVTKISNFPINLYTVFSNLQMEAEDFIHYKITCRNSTYCGKVTNQH